MSSTEALLKKFTKLPVAEQQILLSLSVLFAPVGQTRLQEILRALNCVEPRVYKQIAKPLREKLVGLGLIEANPHGWRCATGGISEVLMRIALDEYPDIFAKLAKFSLASREYVPHPLQLIDKVRRLRFFLYLKDIEQFKKCFQEIEHEFPKESMSALVLLFFVPFDQVWFASIKKGFQEFALSHYAEYEFLGLQDMSLPLQVLEEGIQLDGTSDSATLQLFAEYKMLLGQYDQQIESLITQDYSARGLTLRATLYFLDNHNDAALELYASAVQQLKKQTRKRNVYLPGIHGYFFNLALLKNNQPENLSYLKKQLALIVKSKENDYFQDTQIRLQQGINVIQGQQKSLTYKPIFFQQSVNPYEILFYSLILHWCDLLSLSVDADKKFLDKLTKFCFQAEKVGALFYAAVGATLLHKLGSTDSKIKRLAVKYNKSPCIHMIDLVPRVEKWERALQALTQINTPDTDANLNAVYDESRMVWILTLNGNFAELEPREQKIGKSGRWTKGRPIALKRLLHERDTFEYLTDQDNRICNQIEVEYEQSYYGYGRTEYYSVGNNALIEAIGHPHVYWASADKYDTPITITKAEPQLLVTSKARSLLISLYPVINEETLIAQKTADNELKIYQISSQHRQVAEILGKKGLTVPLKAKQQVIDSITAIASTLTVQSDIGIGALAQNIESVDADARLHVHLQPVGEGLQIEVFIQPFTDAGPIYKPATGGTTVLAEIEGKQVQTTRDFAVETQHLDQLQEHCPELYQTKDYKWTLDDPEMALEALLQIQSMAEFVVMEWPKGKKIKVSREAGLQQVHFSVRKEKDWFSVEGEVQIDDEQVYDMQRLINLLQATSGRFLKLQDGQFIALTNELRQRLDDVAGLGEQKGNKLHFHALAAPALNEAMEGMDVKAGKQWKDQLKKLESMAELEPELPSTLQGELRDYQLEGYQWMARLAHWGAGACLADDMGLGKTIQALSLILSRATQGPTLILAPTSVCMNWLEEAEHFAPTLNVQQFGSGNRQKIIADAAAFDVIVCSYGLLQSEADLLIDKHWNTIVADEAQAIKNGLTKRSKAAMALQGDFKLITTGTPIENHLGELWNLFNFINPGLLGSLKKFNERYAQAIENNKDHGAQQRLKKLLRPFILRRLKNDVLKELPAKTEITIHVELSPEERTFYEAMRRNAVAAMQSSEEQGQQAGQQHLKVLAEIMKLRRACCHPKLVMQDSPLSSAKLQAFEELVDELISNRHKALVFSQFVGHLAIIKELLDSKGISYQYLDGSTPIAKRKKAVNAFQAGEGDVFLISLKAGGSGLNLTAADYVIHMDPWWNPAVEDQASDRAHRMGQKRPVTIYRLVAKDTIEDKIVDLHAHKRDLASSLLEGGEVSGKMSVNEMMSLIREVED
ncbi:DEAD/DEAH box helicase [Methyloprofundus sp.]|uniref:DEAD/DEAH box helicase n=1 Tax=Methyloprofundus sp. TaxID=2020875 RepID=UPI003D0D9770